MDRYFIRSGYHYWQVFDREDDASALANFSARGRGDAAARSQSRAFTDGLNDAYYGREVLREYEDLQSSIWYGRGREIGLTARRADIALLAEEQCA